MMSALEKGKIAMAVDRLNIEGLSDVDPHRVNGCASHLIICTAETYSKVPAARPAPREGWGNA